MKFFRRHRPFFLILVSFWCWVSGWILSRDPLFCSINCYVFVKFSPGYILYRYFFVPLHRFSERGSNAGVRLTNGRKVRTADLAARAQALAANLSKWG